MKLFVANWKMHKTRARGARRTPRSSAARSVDGIAGARARRSPRRSPLLDAARDERGRWSLACQNVAAEAEGAFTGEVSARHGRATPAAATRSSATPSGGGSSARTAPMLARKIARCREAGLTPIYCVGETAEERDAGLTATSSSRQLEAPRGRSAGRAARRGLRAGLGDRDRPRRPRPRTAAAACVAHRRAPVRRGGDLRILYGGSVTPENAGSFSPRAGPDGFLIGGASLSAASFAAIARA